MSEILLIARELAGRSPDATLACSVYAAALKAANPGRQLSKLHPDAAPGTGGRERVLTAARRNRPPRG